MNFTKKLEEIIFGLKLFYENVPRYKGSILPDEVITAIKQAVLECVPEEKSLQGEFMVQPVYHPPPKDGDSIVINYVNYDERRGFNQCRQITINNLEAKD